MKVKWDAIWEAIKEPLREAVLAIIPFVLVALEKIPAVWAILLYAVLRGLDKFLHEAGIKRGLTRF